jgi:hypothetical protein
LHGSGLLHIAERRLDASRLESALADTKPRDVVWSQQELAASCPWSRKLSPAGSSVAIGDTRSAKLKLDLGDIPSVDETCN